MVDTLSLEVLALDITLEEAACFTLKQHHLMERSPLERAMEVVGDILGLNAQGSLNVQIGLWNRVDGLDTGFLPRALHDDRSLVKSWLMRDTVHVVPTRHFPHFRRALEPSLLKEWNRWTVKTGAKESPVSWEPLYQKVLEILEKRPLTLGELREALGWKDRDEQITLSRLVREMSLRGLICHAAASGPWHHGTEYTFARVDKWLPDVDLGSVSYGESLIWLIRGYLRAYGPATIGDFSYWSGIRAQEAKAAFESISNSLVELRIEGSGKFLILDEDAPALLDAKEMAPPVRLLPEFDSLIMGHREKTRFIEPSIRKRIFLPRGDVAATMMIDGRVEGTWAMRKARDVWRVSLSPFVVLSEEKMDEVEVEVEGLRMFTGFEIETEWDSGFNKPHS